MTLGRAGSDLGPLTFSLAPSVQSKHYGHEALYKNGCTQVLNGKATLPWTTVYDTLSHGNPKAIMDPPSYLKRTIFAKMG